MDKKNNKPYQACFDEEEKSEEAVEQRKKKKKHTVKKPVHEKMTTSTLIRWYPITVKSLRDFADVEMQKARDFTRNTTPGYVEPEYILELTKDMHRLGEKSAAEYVRRNKDILMNNYSLKIKQQDILRMKETAEKLEEEIERDEERLERDALNFNKFIKSVESLTDEAVRKTVEEMKIKFKKIEEVRNINAKLFLLRSHITTMENRLMDYFLCAKFLRAAKPQDVDWEAMEKLSLREILNTKSEEEEVIEGRISDSSLTPDSILEADDDAESGHVPFDDVSELLKAIDCFRNENLAIITNSRYVKNTLRDAQETFSKVRNEMENAIEEHQHQIDKLKKEIQNNQETAAKLETLANEAEAQSKAEEKNFQEHMAPQVQLMYETCIGVKGGNLNLNMMVASIESCLLGLLLDIRKIPEKILFKVYKEKQMERKAQKKKANEERRAKAQEERMIKQDKCFFDPPKKKLQRRLMYNPKTEQQVSKKREALKGVCEVTDDEEYFFTQ